MAMRATRLAFPCTLALKSRCAFSARSSVSSLMSSSSSMYAFSAPVGLSASQYGQRASSAAWAAPQLGHLTCPSDMYTLSSFGMLLSSARGKGTFPSSTGYAPWTRETSPCHGRPAHRLTRLATASRTRRGTKPAAHTWSRRDASNCSWPRDRRPQRSTS